MQDVTPELARSFGLPSDEGALVSDIYRGGPAHRAGIRRGDVIVGFNGRPVKNSRELARWAAEIPIGTSVKVEVLREGEPADVRRDDRGGSGRARRVNERLSPAELARKC